MVEFKLVFNSKDGKSVQKQLSGKEAEALLGKKIGDKIEGDKLGFAGYEFEISGGSDFAGFPMKKGVTGFGRKKVLLGKGVGFAGLSRWKKKKKGIRVKKSVCGETVYPKITQINLKILKQGSTPLTEKPAEEGKEEAPAEKPKEAPKTEEKPKEEKKEEPKAEEKPSSEGEKGLEKSETSPKKEAPKEEKK